MGRVLTCTTRGEQVPYRDSKTTAERMSDLSDLGADLRLLGRRKEYLGQIEDAAKRGGRSLQFHRLDRDIKSFLVDEGFSVKREVLDGYIFKKVTVVRW